MLLGWELGWSSLPPSRKNSRIFLDQRATRGRCIVPGGLGRQGSILPPRAVNSFDQLQTLPPPLDLFTSYLRLLNASVDLRAVVSPMHRDSTAADLKSPPAAPSVAAGGPMGEAEKKKEL